MRRNAHTLAELVVVVLIMGVLAAVALPRLQFHAVEQKRLAAAAYKLVADLRRTRSLALRDAATNNKGFEILRSANPWTGYTIENLDSHVTVDTCTFASGITATGDNMYDFGPLGNLTTGGTAIVVSGGGESYSITFIPATGAVACAKN